MSTQIDSIWLERWDVLERRVIDLKNSIDKSDDFPRKNTFIGLVASLRDFAEKQFCYFYELFHGGNAEISQEYPPEYALLVTLEQISYDLEALTRAVEQYRYGAVDVQEALAKSNKLAWSAVQPAFKALDTSNGLTILTYLQKFPEIRVVPYVPLALIGIPLTCVPLPFSAASLEDPNNAMPTFITQDYLAIPHEVGHYVYWHGQIKGQPIRSILSGEIKDLAWGKEWAEEIFADVYGCFIAGPVIALSFQDLQLRVSQEQFLQDDGEHPAPILRPDIYTKVLRKRFDTDKEKWSQKLNDLWVNRRDHRDKKDKNSAPVKKFKYRGDGKPKRIIESIQLVDSQDDGLIGADRDTAIDKIVQVILDLFDTAEISKPLAAGDEYWWNQYMKWSNNLSLYDQFSDHFMKTTKDLPDPPDGVGSRVWGNLYQNWEDAALGYEALKPKIQTKVWLTVLNANGWATKGPGDNPVGGG